MIRWEGCDVYTLKFKTIFNTLKRLLKKEGLNPVTKENKKAFNDAWDEHGNAFTLKDGYVYLSTDAEPYTMIVTGELKFLTRVKKLIGDKQ